MSDKSSIERTVLANSECLIAYYKYMPESSMLKLLYGNDAFYKILGYTKKQFKEECNDNLSKLLFCDIQAFFSIANGKLAIGEYVESELQIQRRDGTMIVLFEKTRQVDEDTFITVGLDTSTRNNTIKQQDEINDELRLMFYNLPATILKLKRDLDLTIEFATATFSEITGYTFDEFREKYNNKLAKIIHKDDLDSMKQLFIDQEGKPEIKTKAEFRIKCKDGIKWVEAYAKSLKYKGFHDSYYAIIHDITDRKILDKKEKINAKKNVIMEELFEDTLFEYDNETDIMRCNKKDRDTGFQEQVVFKDYFKLSKYKDHIAEGCQELFRNTLSAATQNNTIDSFYCQCYLFRDKQSKWYRIRYASIMSDGVVCSVVGKLENVHDEIIEKQNLQRLAEKDSLTGILNRFKMQRDIEEELIRNENSVNALYVLDIDNFKSYNDNFGHIGGDRILKKIATLIVDFFGEEAIVGRYGGDEFMIFEKNTDEATVESTLQKLIQKLNVYNAEKEDIKVSIGAFVGKGINNDFDSFFEKADNAMYSAKSKGKNTYHIARE